MTIRALVDSPWVRDNGNTEPKLWVDFDVNWQDVTGVIADPQYGNYPDWFTSTRQAYENYMTAEIFVEDQQTLLDIDALEEYWVYWDEVVEIDPVTTTRAAVATLRRRDEEPPANEWGALRSRLAGRGYSQAWIDKHLDNRRKVRGVHDLNVRTGYVEGE